MPFGSFTVRPRAVPPPRREASAPPQKTAPAARPPAGKPPAVKSDALEILLMGRNLSVVQDFLCAMNQNMNEALGGEGLSFFARELESISDIIAKKKKLEQFFWTFCQDGWTCAGAEEEEGKTYIFSISPSGSQSRTLELRLRCAAPEAFPEGGEGADAVWLLADGLLFDDAARSDPYVHSLRQALEGLEGTDRPVCLILSQIEGIGRFDSAGGRSMLPDKAAREITGRCRAVFSGLCPKAALIPVQVYGGMECAGADGAGNPVLRISQSGFYQSYIPDNCHIPALYTLQALGAARQTDFLAAPEGGLPGSIRRLYSMKFGTPAWTPDALGGEEQP